MSTAQDHSTSIHVASESGTELCLGTESRGGERGEDDDEHAHQREPTPTLRKKASLLSVRSATYSQAPSSPARSTRIVLDDLDDADASALVDDIEDFMRQSKTIDEFTRIITEFRHERERRSYGSTKESTPRIGRNELANTPNRSAHSKTQPQQGEDGRASPTSSWHRRSIESYRERSDSDPGRHGVIVRCTCCCGLDSCVRARRATNEWADMEQNLRLAAEIGQALLRKHDALVASTSNLESRHVNQRDALMKKLTRNIKESNDIEKRLSQTTLNLEAADSSNRALLAELDSCRRKLSHAKVDKARLAAAESRFSRLARELEDSKQELQEESKKVVAAELKAKKASDRAAQLALRLRQSVEDVRSYRAQEKEKLNQEARETANARIEHTLSAQNGNTASPSIDPSIVLTSFVEENDALQRQVEQTTALLRAANEEVASLREELVNRASRPGDLIRTRSLRAYPQCGRAGGSFNESYHMPSFDSPDEGDFLSGGTSLALAGEVVNSERRHLRTSSLSGPRPLLLAKDTSSQSRASKRDSASPRLGSSRLLSPKLPYIDSNNSTESPQSVHESSSQTIGVFSGRRKPSSEAQRVRAAYVAATSIPSDTDLTSEEGNANSITPAATATTLATEFSSASLQPGLNAPASTHTLKPRDPRTTQLLTLLEYVQRLYTRLSSADVDTLTRRLQRQHLAGDVGHLARVTLNAITRDAEGLREHFRRAIEAEARGSLLEFFKDGNAGDSASLSSSRSGGDRSSEYDSSLVARKDFFALVKLMRDLLFEMAKLRAAINEVQLSPANATRILQEHLGVAAQENKGVGSWFGKLLSTGLAAAGAGVGASSSLEGAGSEFTGTASAFADALANSGYTISKAGPSGPKTSATAIGSTSFTSTLGCHPSRAGLQKRSASRGAAAVSIPSTVAVEVKGSRALASEGFESARGVNDEPGMLASSSVAQYAGLSDLRAGSRPNRSRANLGPTAAHRLSRVQSRNLSGLFAGAPADAWESFRAESAGGSDPSVSGCLYALKRPLSRVVDDDEISVHHGKPGWGNDEDEDDGMGLSKTLRRRHARGLSDSSIHSTFLEHAADVASGIGPGYGQGHDPSELAGLGVMGSIPSFSRRGGPAGPGAASAASRIINRSTLALQAPLTAPPTMTTSGSTNTGRQLRAPSEDSRSTLSVKEKVTIAGRREVAGGGFLSGLGSSMLGGFSSLRPQTSSAALSLAAATAIPTPHTTEAPPGSTLKPSGAKTVSVGDMATASGDGSAPMESCRSGFSTPHSTSPAGRGLLSASMTAGGEASPGLAPGTSTQARSPSRSALSSAAAVGAAAAGDSTTLASTSALLRPPTARGSSRSGF